MSEVSLATRQRLNGNGFCVVEGVLAPGQCAEVRSRLVAAGEESRRRGAPTFIEGLDPNDANVRVFNLLDLDAVFRELIVHPVALSLVRSLLGDGFLISNFTANIAKPGSRSMGVHSDQSIVIPEPWLEPWAINIIWCLDDVTQANGATRYLPGSHWVTRHAELPDDVRARMVAFEAPRGSIIAMDGRMWHTSGENVTDAEERALLFGYYTANFIRPQTNWNAALSAETRANIEPPLFDWLGLGPNANVGLGASLSILGENT
jgi:ectoine hydroxylase-related dioxygenase (phytanoyl-CoA dioxygenase family)